MAIHHLPTPDEYDDRYVHCCTVPGHDGCAECLADWVERSHWKDMGAAGRDLMRIVASRADVLARARWETADDVSKNDGTAYLVGECLVAANCEGRLELTDDGCAVLALAQSEGWS